MATPRVFITRRIHSRAEEVLRTAECEVRVAPEDRPLTDTELRAGAADTDAVLCLLNDKITRDLMQSLPRVRVFANYAVGFDNMDIAAATELGVALSNTPDVLTDATAEIAWALLFAAARRVCEGDRLSRRGDFHGWAPLMLLGHQVAGRTLGIIGAGRIGAAMARGSAGFGMRVLYTKRSGVNHAIEKLGGRRVELDELLRESDFISVHAPLAPGTLHMISDPQFALMKPTAVLVNTGRGPVIDEKALVRALASNRIAAAGLDVYEHEPKIEPELLTMENVVLAPHIGSATHDARRDMAELAANNIVDCLSGRVPRTCINPDYAANRRETDQG